MLYETEKNSRSVIDGLTERQKNMINFIRESGLYLNASEVEVERAIVEYMFRSQLTININFVRQALH